MKKLEKLLAKIIFLPDFINNKERDHLLPTYTIIPDFFIVKILLFISGVPVLHNLVSSTVKY